MNLIKSLIIADGAAFGPEMEKVMKLLDEDDKLHLYLPESFEWLILKSGLLTRLLIARTADTYMKYTKRFLNPVYLQENMKTKILDIMEKIEL